MTEVQKHFLGWDKPFLSTAAKYLQEHYLQGELGSVDDLVVLVSGNAVARRLQTFLVNEATKEGIAVELPSIVTTSQFVRNLVPTNIRLADSQCVLLTTVSVLKLIPQEKLKIIVGARPMNDDDFVSWLQVAKKVWRTIRIASSGGLSIETQTWPDSAQQKLTPDSIERFALLFEIQKHVQQALAKDSMEVAELLQHSMLQPNSELNIDDLKRVVIFGCSDLSLGATLLLERLQSEGITVHSFVRAPNTEEDGFGDFGRLVPLYWMDKDIDIKDETIVVAGSPSSQSAEVVHALSLLENSTSAECITIVSTDEKLIPTLQRHLLGHKVHCRYAGGKPTLQTPEAMLLSGIADFVSSLSYASYAALIRHPEVSRIATVTEETLKQLGEYSANVIPCWLNERAWFLPKKTRSDFTLLPKLHEEMFAFFKPYIDLDKKPSSFHDCASAIRELLLHIYGQEELDRTSTRLKSLQKMFGVLDLFDSISEDTCRNLGGVRLSEVIRFMFSELEKDTIPELPDPLAIETVGWLEGMVADTEHLIVVGMSSDLAGSNNPSDAYFPDRLLDALGLETMERRMARDAHAVSAMLHSRSREGKITWIVGRKNIDGDPLTPSPLLMRCANPSELATRSKKLVVSFDNEKPEVPPQYVPSVEGTGIKIPKPSETTFEPLTQLRVTGFKDYLACTYRFWLKHVMNLKAAEDGNTELDAKLFGSFVHSVLERFGKEDAMRTVSDVKVIEKKVFALLDDVANEQLGPNVSNKIEIQLELARYRLREFAKHQAKSVEDGWTVVCAEKFLEKELEVEGRKFTIRGTIDRVEKNKDGRVRVLDYKTGSTTANKAHLTKDSWVDLQLPLYRKLLTKIPELKGCNLDDDNVELGYFIIGDQESTSGIDLLTPRVGLQESLHITIDSTIISILDNKYSDIPTDPAPRFSEDYSWICQDNSVTVESGDTYDA